MNDFSELESELKKLRPVQPSAELASRIERGLVEAQEDRDNIVRPDARQSGSDIPISWIGLGLGLAAAAAIFLILARVDFRPTDKPTTLASATPALQSRPPAPSPHYQPMGLTQVVYEKHDEGIVFPPGAAQPARRVWTSKRETLRWRDLETGAQLAVSYPAQEITLIPVSGQ